MRRDRGATLVEIVLTIALGALVATAAGTAVTTMLRVGPKVTQAITDAEGQGRLVGYLQQDVRSTPPTGVDLSSTAGGCSGNDPGVNVLQLTWTDGQAVRRTSYRLRTDATDTWIERRQCAGPTLTSLTAGRTARVVSGLVAPTGTWAGGAPPAKVTLAGSSITLELTQSTRVIVLSMRLRTDLGVLP